MGTELKKFAQNGTPEGNETKALIEAGHKAPTSAVVKMAEKFLETNSDKKVLLDGVIRSKDQNDSLESVFGNFDVLYLDRGVWQLATVKFTGGALAPFHLDSITRWVIPATAPTANDPRPAEAFAAAEVKAVRDGQDAARAAAKAAANAPAVDPTPAPTEVAAEETTTSTTTTP